MLSTAFSTDDGSLPYNIRLGIWTNWSKGSVMGSTLTLTRKDASLLIALTAFFISFVGSRFWKIVCFLCHRYLSSSLTAPEDALHHQRQVILRNSSAAESGLWTLIQVMWAWRHHASRSAVRLLPICLMALFCFVSFVLAGVFSANISSSAGDEVLIDGTDCSIFYSGDASNIDTAHDYSIWNSQVVNNAYNYAQQCYAVDSATSMSSCNSYVENRLDAMRDTAAPCPFANDICRDNSSNLILDSGYIDSHNHLGLNSPPDERILSRQVLHCAPIKTTGYNTSYVVGNTSFTRYNYGPNTRNTGNFTYQVSTQESQYTRANASLSGVDYRLGSVLAFMSNGSVDQLMSDFTPIPQLFRHDADVMIFFLSGNGVLSITPIDDPWYRMTKPIDHLGVVGVNGSSQSYGMEIAASPVACTSQFQFCNSVSTSCGPLTNYLDAMIGTAPLFNTTEDWISQDGPPPTKFGSRFQWFVHELSWFPIDISSIVSTLGTTGLASRQSLGAGVQQPLPSNQWQTEVTGWWATCLAAWQAVLVERARGVQNPAWAKYRALPQNQYQRDMCYNQKVRSTLYGSFNMFGLLLTYIAGLLIIIISYLIEPVLACRYRRSKYKPYKYLEWTTGSILQQQRLVHENAGSGDWDQCTSDVPTTDGTLKLGYLDLSDPDHPRISACRETETQSRDDAKSLQNNTSEVASRSSLQPVAQAARTRRGRATFEHRNSQLNCRWGR
ncbi:hypothetical protein PFICI_08083 [Pestalotiopsis fici W106-1]|uniref:Uncharacterized protein n=1 Tax=Pestalotiopsis fici (strain W106-1 / CGMCC3.15140) TaxID=1229662 RepID=W3X3H0_PESFW|nr:uncharacterized protein PFICI_08083 [Pestalotiopsis fici W106-1]ETS80554.1 hypothetical protein PFICI_08083 [Pestalotiopsis fici W106-1]